METPNGAVRLALHDPITLSLGSFLKASTGPTGCAEVASLFTTRNETVDGVIGMDVLSQFVVRIDIARHKVFFLSACNEQAGTPIALLGEPTFPATAEYPIAGHRGPRVLLKLADGDSASFLFDTGMVADSVNIRSDRYKTLVKQDHVIPCRESIGWSFGGARMQQGGVLKSFELGDFQHQNILVEDCSGNSIGLAYMARYVVTFDFPGHRLLLKPSGLFAASEAELSLRLGKDWLDRLHAISPADALKMFDEQIVANPRDARGYRNRARFFSERGEHDKAIADCNAIVRLNPSDANAYTDRGEMYFVADRFDRAAADFSRAIRLKPKSVALFYNRAACYRSKKQFDRAIADYSQAIRLDPTDAQVFLRRGTAWGSKRNYGQAIRDLTQSIRLDPKSSDAWRYRAAAWMESGQFERALADLNEAARVDPTVATKVAAKIADYRTRQARAASCRCGSSCQCRTARHGRAANRWRQRCRQKWGRCARG